MGSIDTIPSNIHTFETIYLPMKDGKKFIECQALKNVGVRIEKLSRDTIKKDFCLLTSSLIKFEDDQALQAIKINFGLKL